MPADISIVNVNGQNIVEAMYANKPAWHGLGEVFDVGGNNAPDSERAIELAHLGWEVRKEQLYLGDGSPAPDCFATTRDDTGAVLGAVGARYSILQNRDAFRFLDSLHADGIVRYESAFALRGGSQVALLARLPSVDQFADGDSGLRYIMLRTSHDGSTEIDLVPTSVRVVCANTIAMALSADRGKRRFSIRHTGNIDAKLAQAREYLSLFDRQFSAYADSARRLAECGYTTDQARQFIDTVFPIAADATERQKTAHAKRVQAVRDAFRHRSNQIPAVRGKLWQLFNAVTFAIDHSPEFALRRRGDDRQRAESQFLSVMDGDGADIKARALQTALAMVG